MREAPRDGEGLKLRAHGRGVGGQIARRRDQDMIRPLHGVGADEALLVEGGFDALNGMEIAILAQEEIPHLRHEFLGAAAADEILRNEGPGLIDLLLQVEQGLEVVKERSGIGDRLRLGQAHGGQVEEAIEINAHRRIKDAARQADRFHTLQALVHGVGEGEGVQGGVPIAEFVAGMEVSDAAGGGIRDDAGELDRWDAVAQASRAADR